MVDGMRKTAFCLQQAMTFQALADLVPDQHAKRIVARGVPVAVDSFIECARQTRNDIARAPRSPLTATERARLKRLRTTINDLSRPGTYSELRDRIGAHRQPIGGVDDVVALPAASALWAQIDVRMIAAAVDAMQSIYAGLQHFTGHGSVARPVFSPEEVAAIRDCPLFIPGEGVLIDTGSYGETRPGSLSAFVGTPVGERVRQLVDTVEAFDLDVTLLQLVASNMPARAALCAALLIDVSSLVELTLVVPDGRHAVNRYAPLVDLVPENYAERADLTTARDTLDPAEVAWLRHLRDTVAAHVDPTIPFVELFRSLLQLDLDRLDRIWRHVEEGLVAADRHPASLVRLLFVRGMRMNDVSRINEVEHPRPYDE